MGREAVDDLVAFRAVAQERSGRQAAAEPGVSQPALSHTIRSFEARPGLRLPTRWTRSVDHLYYPCCRQHAPGFALLVEALKFRLQSLRRNAPEFASR